MSMSIEVGFVNVEESQITREELAKKLEETADKLRAGFIKSASVAMVAEVEDNTIYLSRSFIGRNPTLPKDVGYHQACEVSNIHDTALGGLYDTFLRELDLVIHNEPGSAYWNIGFNHDVEYHTELVVEDHCGSSDEQG